MSQFDYPNARLRGMKSRLFSEDVYQRAAQAGSLEGLRNLLVETSYRESLETALLRHDGLTAIYEGLRIDLANTVNRILDLFEHRSLKLAVAYLRRFDAFNLRTALRGVRANAALAEVRTKFLPAIGVPLAALDLIARSPDLRTALDRVVSLNLEVAVPLLRSRAERGEVELASMEAAVERWAVSASLSAAAGYGSIARPVRTMLRYDIDRANILSLVRLVRSEHRLSNQVSDTGEEDPTSLFIEGAAISRRNWSWYMAAENLGDLVARLERTRYGGLIEAALENYQATGRMSAFERELDRQRLRISTRLLLRGPLGPGVFIAYLTHKHNEIRNLRWAAGGLDLGIPAFEILGQMVMPE